ncbi:ATP-dependent RecD-like DNA helicase [Clostridium sp.]|jgi:DNA replication protein DnaC|uniref:ATP-dependent DNA helicase n=1 Tax=Clostridium sp. TaxID=1506 RepID=UPI00258735EB|nr:ATP-dependent RecD-like DNA helicase [Clostridium sp.]MDF2503045.1 helicase [Clostridium sp.]
MNTNILKIDEAILESNKIICRQISRLGESTRGEVSQEVLESLRHFVEHILLKVYANGDDIEDTQENVKAAVKHAKSNSNFKHLSRFHHFLQVSVSHRALKEQNAERLMLKYYEYLLRIRNFLHDSYSLDVLANLEQFPLETDESLTEYYKKIAEKVSQYNAPIRGEFHYDRFYVQKIKPFFVNGKIYYEIAFVPANDNASKTDRIIAFTDIEVTSFYAVKFAIANNSVEIFGKHMPIRIIVDWEVNIRPCELKNFTAIIEGTHREYGKAEQRELSRYLTETGLSLLEIIMFSDEAFAAVRDHIVPKTEVIHFFDCLKTCRNFIKRKAAGSNILRYLLHHMTNRIIKNQYKDHWVWNYQEDCYEHRGGNFKLSNLYLAYECIPFDEMPFCSGLKHHVPSLSDLFECLDANGRDHEVLAWIIKNNTEQKGMLFTPLEKNEDGKYKLGNFDDVAALVKTYNGELYDSQKQQLRKMIIKYDHIFIESYNEDTVSIIKTIKELAKSGIDNYANLVNYWMQTTDEVNCLEKKQTLLNMFTESKVALIYGSAGTGKSYLINHISHLFAAKSRLYLAQTNPAVNNMRRKVTASAGSTFMTISKFTNPYYKGKTEFDILIIDECSTVNNHDMRTILSKANFGLLVLVGDTYQIEAIEFGNWFDAVRSFLPKASVCELTKPYRSDSPALLRLWNDVRKMEDDIFELLQTYSYSANLDATIFTPAAENEIILCLNYGGLYGINNINHFLQESNNGKEIWRGVQRYKVGDPILFNDSADKFFIRIDDQVPIIHNNMKGRIIDFEVLNEGKANESIQFDIEVDRPLIEMDAKNMDFTIVKNATNGNSVIRFVVNKNKSTDEDDDGASKALVPFQIAYAVSIHKAQGLEYDSVKVIITDEIDELITHSIFYTAITRARKSLKIYWTQSVEKKVLERIEPKDNKKDVALLRLEMQSNA